MRETLDGVKGFRTEEEKPFEEYFRDNKHVQANSGRWDE